MHIILFLIISRFYSLIYFNTLQIYSSPVFSVNLTHFKFLIPLFIRILHICY
nr:MAG TPA: hypothetical protein [Caudoviricetes sp.]